jgi:hypothetical protein
MKSKSKIFHRKSEGKRPLGTTRNRRNDNITMVLKEARCEDMDRNHLVQDKDQQEAPTTQQFSSEF